MNAAKAASRMRSRTTSSSLLSWRRFDLEALAITLSLTALVPYRTIIHGMVPSRTKQGVRFERIKPMKLMIPFLMAALPVPSVAQSQSEVASGVPRVAIPKTTEVLIIQTPRQGVIPQQIMAVMAQEIQATVKLYFNGKIRQWYSRGDGQGVVFLVDAK